MKHTRQLITPVIFSSVLLLRFITRLNFCREKWDSSVLRMTMERWRSRHNSHIVYLLETSLHHMNWWLILLIQQKMVKHCGCWRAGMQMAMVKLTIGRGVYSPQKRAWRWPQFTKKNRLPSRQKSNCHCSLNRNFQLPQSLIWPMKPKKAILFRLMYMKDHIPHIYRWKPTSKTCMKRRSTSTVKRDMKCMIMLQWPPCRRISIIRMEKQLQSMYSKRWKFGKDTPDIRLHLMRAKMVTLWVMEVQTSRSIRRSQRNWTMARITLQIIPAGQIPARTVTVRTCLPTIQ